MKCLYAIMLACCLTGCCDTTTKLLPEKPVIRDAGAFVSSTFIPGGWHKQDVCKVRTTKGIFMCWDCVISGLEGEPCTVEVYRDGQYIRVGDQHAFKFAD